MAFAGGNGYMAIHRISQTTINYAIPIKKNVKANL